MYLGRKVGVRGSVKWERGYFSWEDCKVKVGGDRW